MTDETPDKPNRLDQFREEALAAGIPPDDVDRWLGTARPCAILQLKPGDEPVVGRLGGPFVLPPDAPDPWCMLVATIDLAALPEGSTDLGLPPDGHLMLFADPDPESIDERNLGSALHIPAGTLVEERRVDLFLEWDEIYGSDFPEGPLRLMCDASLPYHSMVRDPGPPSVLSPLPGHPYVEELLSAWEEVPDEYHHPGLQLGGYSLDEDPVEDPAVAAGREAARAEARGELPAAHTETRPEDWVCLAQWWPGVNEMAMACFSWSIARQDLAAGRFDRVYATMTFNP
ncbi:hypothetical protein GCM10022384_25440 [Streptomyces marokkonensis]|uniref:DUF1963 domain-containing protein n=1 Tax=Streptomyces marokkonensis TaxID=324855 RepID=A0ABP7PZ88_9ACTN